MSRPHQSRTCFGFAIGLWDVPISTRPTHADSLHTELAFRRMALLLCTRAAWRDSLLHPSRSHALPYPFIISQYLLPPTFQHLYTLVYDGRPSKSIVENYSLSAEKNSFRGHYLVQVLSCLKSILKSAKDF